MNSWIMLSAIYTQYHYIAIFYEIPTGDAMLPTANM